MENVWINFFHLYQPPHWDPHTIRRVARQSYRPLLRWLKAHPNVRLTFNLTASLTEQLVRLHETEILRTFTLLLSRNQIELTSTAKYHPILPLIPAAEVKRQIRLNDELHRKVFGRHYHPTGFYFPEMSYGLPVAKIVAGLGYQWTILDEIAATGKIGQTDFTQGYTIADTPLKVIFRHRPMSDLFFMTQLKTASVFSKVWAADPRCRNLLITACDGENLGHHHPELLRIWTQVMLRSGWTALTVSEWLGRHQSFKPIHPLASNWASRESELRQNRPYFLWSNPANLIQRHQWQLTKILLSAVRRDAARITPAQRAEIDRLLASDQYWWASASPWWDTRIVLTATAQMYRLISRLWPGRSSQAIRAAKLAQKIGALVRQWQESGLASSLRESYLDVEPFTRYFGGLKVK